VFFVSRFVNILMYGRHLRAVYVHIRKPQEGAEGTRKRRPPNALPCLHLRPVRLLAAPGSGCSKPIGTMPRGATRPIRG